MKTTNWMFLHFLSLSVFVIIIIPSVSCLSEKMFSVQSTLAKRATMETFRDAAAPITLFVYATMNGYKGPICAEELGIPYNYVMVDFEKGQQRDPEYLKINPKGQILAQSPPTTTR